MSLCQVIHIIHIVIHILCTRFSLEKGRFQAEFVILCGKLGKLFHRRFAVPFRQIGTDTAGTYIPNKF